jgi:predicted Zn-dependent protease
LPWCSFARVWCALGQDGHFYARKKEAALGAQLASQVRRQTTPLGLPSVDRYVQIVGQQLAAQMPNAPETWTFSVIKDNQGGSTHEPLSLPGGYIFIRASLLLAVNNETEFAGMLAHAMAHVAERHATRQATHGEMNQLATVPLIFIGGSGDFGDDGVSGYNQTALLPVAALTTRRQYELEADQVAVKAMAAAGFDPNALLSYLERVQAPRSNELSALPHLATRIANLKEAIQNLSANDWHISSESFHSMQDEVRRVQADVSTPKEVYRVPSLIRPDR